MKKDLYRDRLKGPINKRVLNFLSSLQEDLWIAEEDIVGTEVHNIMLYEQKILNKEEIKGILTSLEKLKEKVRNEGLELDESFEDIHPFIEKSVIDEIGMEMGGKIHTGRSRNDQVSVDIRLKIRDNLNYLSNDLLNLFDTIIKRSEETINIYMPLYTHLQRGQLGVFAHYLNNYLAQIIRSLSRIEEVYSRVNNNPLGACAIGGTSININRNRTNELLGFNYIIENSIDAISSRDYIIETLMCLSLISIQFSRIAEDFILWSSKEFGFIELDDQYCSVSSVMPQKKNPDTLELIRGKSSKIISEMFNVCINVKAIPSGYFRDFQELKMPLKNSFEVIIPTIDMLNGIISTIKINSNRIIKAINESYILALDLAEHLVHEYNIPFRNSHKIVANLVKDSANSQDLLDKRKIEILIKKIDGKDIKIPDSFIESINDLDKCLTKRISQGSPSKIEVEKLISSLKMKKELLSKQHLERINKVEKAKNMRQKIIQELMK